MTLQKKISLKINQTSFKYLMIHIINWSLVVQDQRKEMKYQI